MPPATRGSRQRSSAEVVTHSSGTGPSSTAVMLTTGLFSFTVLVHAPLCTSHVLILWSALPLHRLFAPATTRQHCHRRKPAAAEPAFTRKMWADTRGFEISRMQEHLRHLSSICNVTQVLHITLHTLVDHCRTRGWSAQLR